MIKQSKSIPCIYIGHLRWYWYLKEKMNKTVSLNSPAPGLKDREKTTQNNTRFVLGEGGMGDGLCVRCGERRGV